jgi:hypothetical protein
MEVIVYASHSQHPNVLQMRKIGTQLGYQFRTIGMTNQSTGPPFTWKRKVENTLAILKQIKANIILICDGYDVRVMGPASEFLEKYFMQSPNASHIVCARQTTPTHQSIPISGQQFISSSLIVGPKKLLIELYQYVLDELNNFNGRSCGELASMGMCCCAPKQSKLKGLCDQQFISRYIRDNPDKVKLDTDCELFWAVSPGDETKNFIKTHSIVIKDDKTKRKRFQNKQSGKNPCFLHIFM